MIHLGDRVEDKLTDLEGTVIGIAVYLHGCEQCEVQPRKLINGTIVEAVWVDMPQLKVIERAVKAVKKRKPISPGGGVRSHPRRH